jgi:P4 family phage/plasmid primase-like protien|nr:MAG TPA_asm: dsDNA helicase [Caudoviricetes sp.]
MTDSEVYESNLQHFKISKRYGSQAQCKCPAHNDKQASLSVSMGEKCTLFYCHAGCTLDAILSAAGLEKKDTYYEQSIQTVDWRKYVEKREQRKIEAVYNYVSFNGQYAFTKLRFAGKKIMYGRLENERFIYGLPRDTPRKSLKAVYGDLKRLREAIQADEAIFIPEGEKDVDTLTRKGYIAFTYGGVNDWQAEFSELVKGADVIILADNDEPGRAVANTILNDIQPVTKSAKIVVPVPDIPKADISDYFQAGHTEQEFEQLINTVTRNRMEGSAEQQKAPNKPLEDVLRDLHAEQFEASDKGFGRLFATVFKDRHRYNPERRDFMLYDGSRWIDDTEGLAARSSAKDLSDALVRYAVSVDTDGKYLKAVTPLCNIRNRNNMLQDSRDITFFTNEDLDKNDYLLNVQNGTLDLSADKPVFLEHKPEMLLSKICNVSYTPAATCPEWDKFLEQIMQGDKEKIQYLQKIAGLSLTGNTQEETCFILYGSTTRNGKSTFCETLIYLLGDYALTMKPETLAVKQNLDSRQASGDVARLAGCRFCNASEPPKRMLFDTALLKSLLGRDSITARHLHQREFSFIPKFKLVINTNYLPTITDDTVFSSGRINVISFDRHFEPHEQDRHLKDKLRYKNELSGILNWCIDGLRLYRQQGLVPPGAVQKATETYRTDSDKIGNFINECLAKTGRNSKAKDVYDLYIKWCDDNGYGCENKGNFFSELKTKGLFSISGTVDGKSARNIVKGYTIETGFMEVDGSLPLPFD